MLFTGFTSHVVNIKVLLTQKGIATAEAFTSHVVNIKVALSSNALYTSSLFTSHVVNIKENYECI